MTYGKTRVFFICILTATLLLSQPKLFASAQEPQLLNYGLTLNYSWGGPPGKESGKLTLGPYIGYKDVKLVGSLELPSMDFTLQAERAAKVGSSSTLTLGVKFQDWGLKWETYMNLKYTMDFSDSKFPLLGKIDADLHIDTKGNTDSTTSSAYLNLNKLKIATVDLDWDKQKVNIDVLPQLQHYWKILGHIIFGADSGNQSYTSEISGNLTTDAPVPQTTISTNVTYVVDQSDPSIMNFTGETVEQTPSVGGIVVPIDKFGLLAPYIGLASTILAATVASTVYVKRVKRRKEKQ